MKKKIKLGGFLLAYLIFTLVLAILVGAALIYVNSVLDEYEEKHTSRLLEQAIINLKNEAADGTLFQKEGVPAMVSGKFENGTDPKTDFIKKLDSDIKFTSQKWISETECTYGVLSDGLTIAEITMKKIGEPKIKLAIISMQEYELVSYRPVSHTYRIELEDGVILGEEISLTVNGIPLTEADAESSEAASLTFTLTDIYNKPHIEMTDNNGNVCYGKLPDTPNGSVEFDSTLYRTQT